MVDRSQRRFVEPESGAGAVKSSIEQAGKKRLFYEMIAEVSGEPKMLFVVPKKSGGSRVAVIPLGDLIEPVITNVVGQNFQVFLLRHGKEIYSYSRFSRAR